MTETSIEKCSFSLLAVFSLLTTIILKLPKLISKLYITLKYLPRRWHKSGQDSTSEEREHAHIHPIKYIIRTRRDTGNLCINKSVENQGDKKPKETARASRKGRKSMPLLPRQGRAGLQDGPSHVSLYHLLHRDRVLCKWRRQLTWTLT